MTWPMCWTSSCEEVELYGRVAKFVIYLYLTLLLSVIFVISIVIYLYLTLLLSVIFVISIVIELNLPLSLLISNFTTSSILSYVLCDGLSEMSKNRGLVYFHSHAFLFFSVKCNLGYQLCSGCKPFSNLFV